jgi:hypothetical protein
MVLKWTGLVILAAACAAAVPAKADELKAEEARRFIAGKHFAYNCFEGTSGNGKIFADGSVAGYINIRGSSGPRFVVLPAGTLRIRNDQDCASMRGMPFEPCFNVNRTSQVSFRGSLSGLGFAYCDFNRRSVRADVVRTSSAPRSIRAASAGGE